MRFEIDGLPIEITEEIQRANPAPKKATAPSRVPITRKAANLLSASGRAARAVFTGNKVVVSDEEKARRLGICAVCEFYTGTRCRKCGCVMRFKARLATEHCPIAKW